MAYGDFKDLVRITGSDKVLRDKAFNIAQNPKYDGYQRELACVVYKFFDKKFSGRGANMPLEFNEELAKELHNTIIRKFKKRTVFSGSKDNIWGANLTDMHLISKFNKGFRFILCVIDTFSNYAWVVLLKYKKGASIVDALEKLLDKLGRKPNKIWADKESEFCNGSFKNGEKLMILKFIRYIMRENLLLLKDLSEL